MSGYLYNSLNTSIIGNNPKPPVLDNADLESHLLLMVDTANINSYSLVNGTHTIKNMVDLSTGTIISSNLTNQGTLGFQFSHTDSRILLPTVTNARSIVFWYKVNSLPGAAFILDARNGSANSAITSYGGGDVEGAFLGISLEIFTGPTNSINTLTDANTIELLFNSTGGWKMVILNPLTPITDDITFFNRYQDFFYGLFANIGPILIFDKPIIDRFDKSYLYNLFASRYSLKSKLYSSNTDYIAYSVGDIIINNTPKPPVLDNADLESHLLLYFDTANLNCYSSGNTIINAVDNTTGSIVGTTRTDIGLSGYVLSSKDCRVKTPSVSSVRSIVLWYKSNNLNTHGNSIFLDAREGINNSWITNFDGGGGQIIGTNWKDQSLNYFDSSTESIQYLSNSNYTFLFNNTSWRMLILNSKSAFTDDITFFNRYDDSWLAFGTLVTFGPILIFDKAITDTLDKSYLYNLFASRYGLAEIPSTGGIPTSLLQSKILIESTLPSASFGKYRLTSADFDGIINLSQVSNELNRRSILKSTIKSLFTIANDPAKNVLDLTTNSLQVDISALPFPSQITKLTVDILENNQSVNLSTFTTNNTALYCVLDSSGDYLRVNTLTSFIKITNISNGEFKVETGNPSSITTVSEGESDTFDGFFYVLGSITGQSSGENTVVCLHPDTLILMSNYEYKPIHSIREGEYVMTLYGSSQVQKKLYMKSTMSHNYPYRIPKDYFQKNIPMEDLIISPNHRMLIENQMISCQMMKHHHSLNGLTQIKEQKEHEYYHLKLEHSNSLMNANGVWVDSNQREILPESRF